MTEPDERVATCNCGHKITLTRALLDQPGGLVECPTCGHELRVWQWAAKANRHQGSHPAGAPQQ